MEQVKRFVRNAARRLGTQALLEAGAAALAAGFGAAALLVLAERLLAFGANLGLLVAVPLLAALLAGAVAGLARWPSLPRAALAADGRLGLDERLSSALAAGGGPMADLVRADAARHVAAIDLRQKLAVAPPRFSRALALAAIGLAVALLVPPLDLLGWGAARAARARERAAVREATDAALASIGKLGDSSKQQGLDRTARTLEQIERALRNVAGSDTSPAKARDAVDKVLRELDEARKANSEARKAETNPKQLDKAQREGDLLLRTSRVLEGWEEQLKGGSQGGPRVSPAETAKGKKKEEGGGTRPAEFVRATEPVPVPREAIKVESRLLTARPAADAAMRRDDVPWRYRALVRRYFSPDEEDARPGP